MKKFYQTKKFKKLSAEWKQKLVASGFTDIEDERGNLRQHDRRTISWDNQDAITCFYTTMASFLEKNPDLPEKDKKVLELYCEGVKLKTIARRLDAGYSTIKNIVSKYKKIAAVASN